MTWHLAAHRTIVMGVVALCAAGCGSSGGRRAAIELLEPENMAELTIEDDIDPDTSGVQYEVRARTQNIRNGTTMLLVMPGENTTSFTTVDDEGLVVFENATLPPGPHAFHIQNATGSVSSREYSYTLKTLVIETPRDGAGIAFGDDINPSREGLQINVTVKAYAIDGSEDIELTVDGVKVGDAVSPDSNGGAVFRDVTLSTGVHELKAIAGNVESSVTTVDVNEACASVSFVSPEPGSEEDLTLAGGDSCPAAGDDYTIDVVISTDAGDGREVELTVNSTTKQIAKVEGSLARFEDVVLNRRMTANELSVTVQGRGGVTCAPVPFPKDIFVDCAGSDCSIGSPVPFSGDDAQGEPVFYLNRSMLNDGGFDIRVDSDVGVIGQEIELIIDGRDGRSALKQATRPNASRISATFSKVELSAGTHTIEARCRDGSGNVTESGEVTWVVDVDGCGVQIDSPANDARILPGDDGDDGADGIQIEVQASIEGDDCMGARAVVCADDEIDGDGFQSLEGSSISETVTLEDAPEQRVCVEVRDRADNRVIESVGVKYRSEAPSVEIESPGDLTSFNAKGTDGKTADSDSATPACNADFHVACTELGGMVELHRGDEAGPVIASGTCEARAGGDPELPAGFNGRARLDDVVFLPVAEDNASITATQVLSGLGGQSLLGKSATIALTGWCEPPGITLFPGCPAEQIELPGGGGDVIVAALQTFYSGAIASRAPDEAVLTVIGPSDDEISSQSASLANGGYRFTNINLGDVEQRVESTIALTDDYGNTTEVMCATTLVSDLPELTIESPADGVTFAPGDGCDPGTPDKFGVPVSVELDQDTDRELGYSVNGGPLESLPVDDTEMDLCIPVNDGANMITFQLDSTASEGVVKPSINVFANAMRITEPAANAVLLESDDFCDPDFGAHVVAEVATAFEGSDVTVTAGGNNATTTVSGGVIDACVTLPSGRSTITVSLDGKSLSRTVDVSVVTGSPTNTVTLTGVTLPSGADYRTGQIRLNWAEPDEDFEGQLASYQLRCAATAIANSATDQEKNDWWDAAREIPLSGVVPPETSAAVGIRIGETVQCVIRGADAADQLTPISDSVEVSYPFREHKVDVSELNRMGYALASVGDVNDDNIDDVLIGGSGRAYLYFGNAGGLAAKTNPNSPDVTFTGMPVLPEVDLGSRIAALGDINGDGEADFAMADPVFSPTGLNQTGAVYVFYGRKSADPWDSVVNLASSDANACPADVCFIGEVANEGVGRGLAAAGDFNGDGRGDLAIGATGRPVGGVGLVGRLYVLLGRAFEGTGGTRPTKFWNINIRLPGGGPLGFYVDGTGDTGTDATSSFIMGHAIAPLGNVDGVAGGDLLVIAQGRPTAMPITSKLYFLSGRAHNGAAPNLRAIASSALELRDSGTAGAFGSRMASLRNWYDDTESGVPDVAVFQANVNRFYVYLGDENGAGERYSNGSRITVTGPAGQGFSNAGLAASRGYVPNIGSISRSDIDADGLDDICVGSATGPGGSGAGPIYVFYGSSVEDNLSSNQLGVESAAVINLSARTGATARTVQPVGDLTGDGVVDLVVGEPNANSNAGGVTILY